MTLKLNWVGPHFVNKGERKKAVADAEFTFYQTLTKDYQAQFAGQKAVLDVMTAVFRPIFEAGPTQRGFAPEMEAAVRTEAKDYFGAASQQAQQAMGEAFAARGGGQIYIPSGAEEQIKGQAFTEAALAEAKAQTGITKANYEQGYNQWMAAANAMAGVAGLQNPVGYAGVATTAGENAMKGAVEAEKGGFWSAVGGILGGAAQSFAEGLGGSYGQKLGGGKK